MKSEILAKQKQAMVQEGLDALVAVSPENVIYTCGFVIPSLRIQGLRRRLAMTVVTPDDRDALIVVDMESSTATGRSKWFTDIRTYEEFDQEASECLIDTLKEFGLARGRIGIELDYIPAMDCDVVRGALPAATFVNAEELFLRLRSVKTREEVKRLRRLGRLADGAHEQVRQKARAGMTEREIGNIILESLYTGGMEDAGAIVVASGERSVLPNVGPSDRVLQPGDIVRIDIMGHIGAYCSDCARTYIVGDPTPEQAAMGQKHVDALNLVKAEIRPGVSTGNLYRMFSDYFRSVGLNPFKFLAHGLGLSVHEYPWIAVDPRFDMRLEQGMVLCVEPVQVTETEGYQLEDTIIVTGDGFELVTDKVDTRHLVQIAA